RGGAGTIYYANNLSSYRELRLANNSGTGGVTLLPSGISHSVSEIILTNSAILQLKPGRDGITTPLYEVSNGGVLELNSYTT
ncbi:hypothetical protein RZS08_01710, partial [Arthrospira platensis SPKY1]|nr:hypothetical protein [Arthrospira platensis SPKY1]